MIRLCLEDRFAAGLCRGRCISTAPSFYLIVLLLAGCGGARPDVSGEPGRPALVAEQEWAPDHDMPQRAGDGLRPIDDLLQAEVDSGHVAGAAVLIRRRNETLHRGAYGYAQRFAFGGVPLDPPDTLTTHHMFDLASLTKVFATTFGIMLLVDRDQVDLDAPVSTYLPAFSGTSKDSVTVRHLLTHTSGLTPWEPIYYHASSPPEAYAIISARPLDYGVGTARRYSDLGFMLLGYLVEAVSGHPLDEFLTVNLYGPLGLESTMFTPLEHGIEPERIAATSHGNPFERKMVYDDEFGYTVDVDPTSWNKWREHTLRGEVNDGNAYYAHGGVAGHAGLFSTIDDLQRLVDLLLQGGRTDGKQLISREVIREFLTPDAFGNGLGWAMEPGIIQARGAPAGTFGHTGFTGTNVVVVPTYDLSIILLTNRQNVGSRPDGSYYNLNPIRQRVVEIALDAVGH